MRIKIKKNDTVKIMSGNYRGKTGKVKMVDPKSKRVIVEGVAITTRHKRATKMGEVGGKIKQEAAIDISKVMLVCPRCGEAARVGITVLDNGDRVRYCKKCKEIID